MKEKKRIQLFQELDTLYLEYTKEQVIEYINKYYDNKELILFQTYNKEEAIKLALFYYDNADEIYNTISEKVKEARENE